MVITDANIYHPALAVRGLERQHYLVYMQRTLWWNHCSIDPEVKVHFSITLDTLTFVLGERPANEVVQLLSRLETAPDLVTKESDAVPPFPGFSGAQGAIRLASAMRRCLCPFPLRGKTLWGEQSPAFGNSSACTPKQELST